MRYNLIHKMQLRKFYASNASNDPSHYQVPSTSELRNLTLMIIMNNNLPRLNGLMTATYLLPPCAILYIFQIVVHIQSMYLLLMGIPNRLRVHILARLALTAHQTCELLFWVSRFPYSSRWILNSRKQHRSGPGTGVRVDNWHLGKRICNVSNRKL